MKLLPLIFMSVCSIAVAGPACDRAPADLISCASEDYFAADKRLNQVYARLYKLLDSEGQHKLRDAQRAWVKFRDLNAEYFGDINRGGRAESLNILGTKETMTLERIKELETEIEARK